MYYGSSTGQIYNLFLREFSTQVLKSRCEFICPYSIIKRVSHEIMMPLKTLCDDGSTYSPDEIEHSLGYLPYDSCQDSMSGRLVNFIQYLTAPYMRIMVLNSS